MAIVFNSDAGTISGLSVGGLPDGIVDAGTLATNSVDSAELIDGAVDDSHIGALAASKLTGALPAISGASLTGITTGKVLQVVQAHKTDTWTTSTSGTVDITGLSVTITPSATSSKLLITSSVSGFSGGGHGGAFIIRDGSTTIGQADASGSRNRSSFSGHLYTGDAAGTAQMHFNAVACFLYSPSTTSAVTLKIASLQASGIQINYQESDGDSNDYTRGISHITVMEIGA